MGAINENFCFFLQQALLHVSWSEEPCV